MDRGTRTRLQRVKTRQVHVTRSVPGRRRPPARRQPRRARPGATLRRAQRRLALNRFPAGHGDVPTEGSHHGATARLPGPATGNAAILRQCGRRPPTPPAGHAREVEPGGPGHTPFGPQARSSTHPMRSIGASRRPCSTVTTATWTGCGRASRAASTARQPSATARTVPAVSIGQNGGESGTGRYGDPDPAEPRRSGRFKRETLKRGNSSNDNRITTRTSCAREVRT